MKIFTLMALVALAISTASQAADDVDYEPGGQEWSGVWQSFYENSGSEEDLMTPLVEAGPTMVPAILEAISHKDMRLRRYAIGALGNLSDTSSVDPLAAIVADKSEEEYFRGDALSSIYKLDQERGTELAKEFAGQGDTLKMICEAIVAQEPWLLAGLGEEAGASDSWPPDILAGTEPIPATEFEKWVEEDPAKYEGSYEGDVGGDSGGQATIEIEKSESGASPIFVSGTYTLTPAGQKAFTVKFDNLYYDGEGDFIYTAFDLRFVKLGDTVGLMIGRIFIPKR